MSMSEGPSGRSFFGAFVLIFAAMAALFVIDTFLARLQLSEDRAEATRLFREGREMAASGRYSEAAERFKSALSVDRENREYRLALAEAFTNAKKFPEAESALTMLLQQDSTDGDANLAMARLLAAEGKPTEASSYYHRAIYGRWKANATENPLKARFELVDLLAKQNAKEGLLAELLPLQEEAPKDATTRKRLGQLFLAAGSPGRAADVFRQLLRDAPRDPEAYAGLGEAEFARTNYQAALADFLEALRLKPGDTAIRRNLELCEQILSLDPTRRGLPVAERYRRSVKLVAAALDEAKSCLANSPDPAAQATLNAAARAIQAKAPESRQSAAVEPNLDLAEQLWRIREKQCPAEAGALALVLSKIAR